MTLPVLKAFLADPGISLLEAENIQVESRAGASSTESILELELYAVLEAESTCSGSVSVYNSNHTIAERARLRGVHSGPYECVLILLTDRNLTGVEMY